MLRLAMSLGMTMGCLWGALAPSYVHADAVVLPASTQGCNSTLPVLQSDLRNDGWFLALASDRPEVITHARLSLKLIPPTTPLKQWSLEMTVTFADPKPFGLPYSFEKLEVQWPSGNGVVSALHDWTDSCTQVGRAIFPGQQWVEIWEIPGTEGLSSLEKASFSLWGSRS